MADLEMKPRNDSFRQFTSALHGALARLSMTVSDAQTTQLYGHYLAIIEANRSVNLTRIVDPIRAAVLHCADSLALLAWIRNAGIEVKTVLDIGTGAGFPSLPLAIVRSDWNITALDATRKKVDFLSRAISDLGIKKENLRAEHGHSAHWETRNRFDLVTLRAVAELGAALRDSAKFVAANSWLVAYKTARMTAREREEAGHISTRCKLREEPSFAYNLVLGEEIFERQLVIYRKQK